MPIFWQITLILLRTQKGVYRLRNTPVNVWSGLWSSVQYSVCGKYLRQHPLRQECTREQVWTATLPELRIRQSRTCKTVTSYINCHCFLHMIKPLPHVPNCKATLSKMAFKHYEKRRKCWSSAFSPFSQCFLPLWTFENLVTLKFVVCNASNQDMSKYLWLGNKSTLYHTIPLLTSLRKKAWETKGPWGPESLYWHWLASIFRVKESTYKKIIMWIPFHRVRTSNCAFSYRRLIFKRLYLFKRYKCNFHSLHHQFL